MSEYVNKEDVIEELQERVTFGGEPMPNGFFKFVLEGVPSANVIEVSRLLETADEQEKLGYIQTADVLRRIARAEY